MERVLSYIDAIREGTDQEMARNEKVIVLGMGVDDAKAIQGTTRGLLAKYGPERVFDTPLAEEGMLGVSLGAALAGLRPMHVHIRMDFLLLAMNQLVNMAAKMHYMYGGASSVPVVIRCMIGESWGQGPQHSQSLYPMLMNIPGLRIVLPTTPFDAKGALIASLRDKNPVVFIEHRMLHFQKSHVPEEPYEVPFGKARVMVQGKDLTLVGISFMALESLRASHLLKPTGITCDVIDPVSVVPLDLETIVSSVKKTKRLLVVDNAWTNCGAGAEIAASVMERLQSEGAAPVGIHRTGFAPTPCPTTSSLERLFYPNAHTIASRVHAIVNRGAKPWAPEQNVQMEEIVFKGPF